MTDYLDYLARYISTTTIASFAMANLSGALGAPPNLQALRRWLQRCSGRQMRQDWIWRCRRGWILGLKGSGMIWNGPFFMAMSNCQRVSIIQLRSMGCLMDLILCLLDLGWYGISSGYTRPGKHTKHIKKLWEITMLLMGKSTNWMAIFNSYVKLPEGIYIYIYTHIHI